MIFNLYLFAHSSPTLTVVQPWHYGCLFLLTFVLFTSTATLSNVVILVANASSALCLNLAVLLTIGRLSALTLNIGGVVKDWLLIAVSSLLFQAPISGLQLQGYGLAFLVWIFHGFHMLVKRFRV